MVSLKVFKQLALSFPDTREQPHFDKSSFRVSKKIFATLDEKNKKATLKLSQTDQSVFCSYDLSVIYPVTGTWGKQGWTTIDLSKIKKSMLLDALTVAYCSVAPKKFSEKYPQNQC